MSKETNELLDLFSQVVGNPKMMFALRGNMMQQRMRENGNRQGARSLLFLLWEEDGLTNSEIAEKLDVKPSSVTNMVKKLDKKEMIKRVQDEQDKRVTRIFLTEKGRELEEGQKNHQDEISEELFDFLSEEEKSNLIAILKRIISENTSEDFEPNHFNFHGGIHEHFGQGPFGRGGMPNFGGGRNFQDMEHAHHHHEAHEHHSHSDFGINPRDFHMNEKEFMQFFENMNDKDLSENDMRKYMRRMANDERRSMRNDESFEDSMKKFAAIFGGFGKQSTKDDDDIEE